MQNFLINKKLKQKSNFMRGGGLLWIGLSEEQFNIVKRSVKNNQTQSSPCFRLDG